MTTFNCAVTRIANFIVSCRIRDNDPSLAYALIELPRDEVDELKPVVARILKSGKKWDAVLRDLHGIATKSFHIGFKEQDRIIAACNRNGVHFAE